ncbi:MAG TPA: alcohol dehydrogenase catalytic domain-containing protein, partial [Bryobacteraceae bacterium]|nr:alcohol dehydrogenase catalytic domain-containing protein [Bryobacteraceae bacterium]
MRAIALNYSDRSLIEKDVPEPSLTGAGQVLFRVSEVGICGTDRDLASFRILFPPAGDDYLVLGHECVGEVLAASTDVSKIRTGDLVVPLVRRPCAPACDWCGIERRDLCSSGKYTERGIVGAHGYFTELAVDSAADLVVVPEAIRSYAVLVEPLSVVEKAIGNAFRLHPGNPARALVLGAGAVGLLSAMGLAARGLAVTLTSLEPPGSERARLAEAAGASYETNPTGSFDIVIEAAGAPAAARTALAALGPAGVLVMLGVTKPVEVPMLQLILRNQVVAGSVNAAP